MCTVSYAKLNDKIIITSNRDEQVDRHAIEPQKYFVNHKNLIFPKDPNAGGTWFVADEFGNAMVLLNGAEEKHIQKESYQKSRGLIVLEIFGSHSAIDFWNEINLENVAPFTLVLFQDNKLYQLRWNEIQKHKLELDTNQFHIWSSATLYSKEIRSKRSQWFYDFIDNTKDISEYKMIDFHQNTESENADFGLIINRNELLKTLSITQFVRENQTSKMSYFDLINELNFIYSI